VSKSVHANRISSLKTRAVLHEALLRLIREGEYHRISVSQILRRANVGRSTFYTHFRDKEALFASAVEEMLESVRATRGAAGMSPAERLIGFGLPLLQHIERHRNAGGARMGHRGRATLHEHVRQILTRWVAQEMSRDPASRRDMLNRLPPDLLPQYVASTFVLVLDWWVDHKHATSSAEADTLFRSLVLPAVRRG
jgi:AcrR family transcriptional regulator